MFIEIYLWILTILLIMTDTAGLMKRLNISSFDLYNNDIMRKLYTRNLAKASAKSCI